MAIRTKELSYLDEFLELVFYYEVKPTVYPKALHYNIEDE